VRVVSLHPDVLVATSAIWQTNCVVVRGGSVQEGEAPVDSAPDGPVRVIAGPTHTGETFVIDSPILPDELDALPALVEQAGFPAPSGLLATHGDWDHLLGRLAFPELALGCAESTAARMGASPGEAQRELRAFDEEHFIERARPLSLGAIQALPAPGSCGIGTRELDLHPASGHTGDGVAIAIPWAGVLLAGDYISPVELPVLGTSGAVEAYASTLVRLRPLVEGATHIIPGHGGVLDSARALALLDEDLAYVRDVGPSSSTRLRRSSRSARPPRSARPR
jgi:glyoxylase-like metal-dependent hydrolase (beta-lactamase superfamily II)